jgi:hypothetical protein
MKWSFKKQPKDEAVLAPAQKTSLFDRKARNTGEIEDVDVVEVVSVMADVYPERETDVESERASTSRHALTEDELESEFPLESDIAPESVVQLKKDKKLRWKKTSKGAEPETALPHQPGGAPRPIKVLIGFLPDSSERDTYFYMLGIAQKNLDSENIGWAGMARFENGYAYEIHEGGAGRGYLESILTHFRSLPAYSAEETYRAHIRTAMRTVRIERTSAGLYSVILPESDTTPQSDWLTASKKLAPLVEKRTGLFLGGAVLFLTSLIALMGGYATRYQPYVATTVSLERVPVDKLPHSQWDRMTNLTPGDYVQALKFENNEWTVQTPSNKTGGVRASLRNSRQPRDSQDNLNRRGGPPRPGGTAPDSEVRAAHVATAVSGVPVPASPVAPPELPSPNPARSR